MKKFTFKLFVLFTLPISLSLSAQMGVNTENPQAVLDVVGQGNTAATKTIRVSNSDNLEIITVNDAGRVGINQLNPDALLHVSATISNGIISERANTGPTNPAYLTLRKNKSVNPNVNVAVTTGDIIGVVAFSGNTGNGYAGDPITSVPSIVGRAAQPFTPTSKAAYLEFKTVPNGSVVNATRMTINQNGLIGIGRVPTTNRLEIAGNASKTTAGAFIANSDVRLKKDIQSISGTDALEKIHQLKGIYYYWNDNKTGIERPKEKQIGFTAQNIQEVFPEKVETDNQGYLQTAYGDYDAIFVEAIKALDNKIKTVALRIDELKKENVFLKEKVK